MSKEPKETSLVNFMAGIGIFVIIMNVLFHISRYIDKSIDVVRVINKSVEVTRVIDKGMDIRRVIDQVHTPSVRHRKNNFKSKDSSKVFDNISDINHFTHNELTDKELIYLDEQKIFSVSHYIVIPDNKKAYKKIFSKEVSSTEIEKIYNIKKELEVHSNIYISKVDDSKSQLESFISSSESEFVTLTGHNDNGYFIFPNGSKIQINKISEMCVEFKKRCIFLSCKSNRYIKQNIGVNVDLSFFDAEYLIQKINYKSQQNKNEKISYDDFSLFVREELDTILLNVQFKSKVIYHIKRGSKVSGIGIISYSVNELLDGTIENSEKNVKNK